MPANEIEVTIGSVQLNQSLSAGSNFYLLKNTPELLSAISTRQSDNEKQGDHGSEDSLSWTEPRILKFEGEIHASTQATRVTMEQNLRMAVALSVSQDYATDDGYKLLLITDEDGVAKQIYAKILEMPTFELIEDAMPEARKFEFTMYAKDPTLYAQSLTTESGQEAYDSTTFVLQDGALPELKDGDLPYIQDTIGSQMTVTHSGTYGAAPVFTITGPTEDPIITNVTTGKAMKLTKAGGITLTAGQTITINVLLRTIVKNDGTDLSGKLSDDSDWIYILPGDTVLTLFDSTPADLSTQLQIDFRSAWL